MAGTIWKGHLGFGLVSIPVKLVRAARPERINLHQLHRAAAPDQKPEREPEEEPEREPERGRPGVVELPIPQGPVREALRGSARGEAKMPEPPPAAPVEGPVERVRQAAVTPGDERPIPASEVVKGYEYEPERWVLIDKEEIKRIQPKTSQVMQILEFVRFGEIDPVYLESSYYVVPEKSGEKAYSVFYQALRETNYAAVAEVAMHGRDHIVILRSGRAGLIGHTMFFENEVRKELEHRTDTSLAAPRELELAKMLIESLAGAFQPEKYRDTYREKLEALIAAKVGGQEVVEGAAAPAARAPVVDIMEALEKSLAAARKGPASAAPPERKPGKKKASR